MTYPTVKPPQNAIRWEYLLRAVWGVGIVLLPITSLPLITRLSGGAIVAPPSVLVFMLLALVLPVLSKTRKLAIEIVPFGLFLIVVLLSWGMSFFLIIPTYRNFVVTSEYKEALLTLGIAAAVFLSTMMFIMEKRERLGFTLRMVNLSGFVMILWSLVQTYYVLFQDGSYPRWAYQIQDLISSRSNIILFPDRVTGLAYEPSWLAHQLVIVFLPYWFAASLIGYSSFTWRFKRLSLENMLSVCGVFVLFMSFSRIGWLSFLLILLWIAWEYQKKFMRAFASRFLSSASSGASKIKPAFTVILGFLVSGFLIILVLLGFVWLGSKFEPRLAMILTGNFWNANSLLDLANHLFFAERAVYWGAGWEVFARFPWFGVGFGNVGFFFPETMPSFGYGLTEVRDMFYRLSFLPNTKSIWIRILSETGIVGFSCFITWLFYSFVSTQFSRRLGNPEEKVIAWMGQFVLIAFLSEGFSIDSFAMPYFWFSMGMLCAGAALTRERLLRLESTQAQPSSVPEYP